MGLYVTLIFLASVLFSVQFIFTKKFQLHAGADTDSTFLYTAVSPIVYLIVLAVWLFAQGEGIAFTPFSIIVAFGYGIVCNACIFFSLKALSLGSMTNYSLWLLSGGMILPAIYGWVFNGEQITVWIILGFLLVITAILLKIDYREKAGRNALICCALLFLSNGFVSVFSAVHQGGLFAFDKVNSLQFSFLCNLSTLFVGAVMFLFRCLRAKNAQKPRVKGYLKSLPWAVTGGAINGLACLLLLLSLGGKVPASLQYSLVTGSGIFFGAVEGLIFKEKLSKKSLIAVVVAIVGTTVMLTAALLSM